MAGVPITQKANLQITGNLILAGAGGANFVPAAVANLAYSVANSYQPNITRVGNLNINTFKVTGGVNGQYLQTDGTGNLAWVSGGGSGNGVVGGSNTQIQFNNAGDFGGSSSLTWDQANGQLNTVNFAASSATNYGNVSAINVNASGNLIPNAIYTNNYFYANGDPFSGGGNGTPGGSNTQVQFNDEGNFGGEGNFTYDSGNHILSVVRANASYLTAYESIDGGNSVVANYFIGDGSQLTNIPSAGTSGEVQVNWLSSFSNQGGTPGDTYSTLQFDSNGMPTLNGTNAYQQRVDYSPYMQILAPRVESTDFGIVAGSGLTVVGYDDTYNTPRSAYLSVQDQSNATQQWDFGILGNGNNNFVISDRTNSNQWTFGTNGNLTLPTNTFSVNYANGTQVPLGGGNTSQISNGNSNVSIPTSSSNVYINTNDGNSKQWTFYTTGNLRTPGNVDIYGAINFPQQVSNINWSTYNIELSQYGRINTNVDFFANANVIGAQYLKGDGSNISNISVPNTD